MRNFCGYWDQDLALMYSYLEDMEIVSGTDRQKMYKMKKRDGGSALFGHTWKKYLSPTKNRPPSKKFKNLFETKLLTQIYMFCLWYRSYYISYRLNTNMYIKGLQCVAGI